MITLSSIDESAIHQCYLRFLVSWNAPVVNEKLDPFSCQWPLESEEDYSTSDCGYYVRSYLQEEVIAGESCIIVGAAGSGKSVLFHQFPFGQKPESLSVKISLQDTSSPMTLEYLGRRIFDAYWKKHFNNPSRLDHLSSLCKNSEWVERLRWFCHLYTPIPTSNTRPFQLLDIHRISALSERVRAPEISEKTLQELLEFVNYRTSSHRKWGRVFVLIDDIESHSLEEVVQFVIRVLGLCDSKNPLVQFKLFVDSSSLPEINTMDCVRKKRISKCPISRWHKGEIRALLRERILAYRIGEPLPDSESPPRTELRKKLEEVFDDEELRTLCYDLDVKYDNLRGETLKGRFRELIARLDRMGQIDRLLKVVEEKRPAIDWAALASKPVVEAERVSDWARDIPRSSLEYEAQREFVDAIVEGAIRAYELKDEVDAPIHALRLARFLLTACANCSDEHDLPLTRAQIEELVSTYWRTK